MVVHILKLIHKDFVKENMSRYHIVTVTSPCKLISMDVESKTKKEAENKFKEKLSYILSLNKYEVPDVINLDNPPHWFPHELIDRFNERWENGHIEFLY